MCIIKTLFVADSDLEISDRKLPANVIEEIEGRKSEDEEVEEDGGVGDEIEFIEKPERTDIEKKLE